MIFNEMKLAIAPILGSIHRHPFNQELSRGTLSIEKFVYYLQQDALYLQDFSRALALIAARLPLTLHSQQLIQFSLDALHSERELHTQYIGQFSPFLTKPLFSIIEASPACFMYSNYILKMASLASIEEAMACILPCFFIYHEVSQQMAAVSQPDNQYHKWITLYSGKEFEQAVNIAIGIVNSLAENSTSTVQNKMIQAFKRASELEYFFWESAYHLEQWKILGGLHVV